MKLIRKEKGFGIAILGVTIICLIIAIYNYRWYQQSIEAIKKQNNIYLEEISTQIEVNVNQILDNQYLHLEMMADIIKESDVDTIKDLHTYVEAQKKYWQIQKVMLVDSNGLGHTINGPNISLDNDIYLKKTILNKENSFSTLQTINNKKTVIFAVPIEDVFLEGENIVALAVSYEAEVFEKALSMTLFGEKAYSYIIDKEGFPILRSTSSNTLDLGSNVLHTIKKSQMDENSDYSKMLKQIKEDQSGQIGFTLNGTHTYMTYIPIESKQWYILSFLPLSLVDERTGFLFKMMLLNCFGIILINFILTFILIKFYRRYREELEAIAYVDPITDGDTLQSFFKKAGEIITSYNQGQYALVYTNVKNFKVLNEQLGHSGGDEILRAMHESIEADLTDKEFIGRVTADHFCILLKYQNNQELQLRFVEWYEKTKRNIEKRKYNQWIYPEIEFGVYVIENNDIPLKQMVDRAKLALREIVHLHNTRLGFAVYDDRLRLQLLREVQIEKMMEDALKNGEFQVYLQPKYSLPDERIVGAEALTRWISETEGMIYPDEFIPIFERNGFIVQLDLWIFEEVCRLLRHWLKEGKEPIKVSINCSRVHFKKAGFFKEYVRIAESYNVPVNLIEIELTENLVLEDMEHFMKIVDEIRKAGFGCSIDDFGSGYSSLNLIKDIPVDTLKLDKVFFRKTNKKCKRGEFVVKNIISMAKELSMEIVAEGVEEREQVEMLKRLGCDYVQGYVFAKPMPIQDFEQ